MSRYSERDKILAAKIGRTPEQLPMQVRLLLDHCIASPADIPKTEKTMGSLKGDVTPQEFEDFILNLCRGLQYSFEKFGTSILKVALVDQVMIGRTPLRSDASFEKVENKLVIQRSAIARYARAKRLRLTVTHPLMPDVRLSPEDGAVLIGVEEGYHAYQWLTPKKRRQLEAQQKDMDREAQRREADPQERKNAAASFTLTVSPTYDQDNARERLEKEYAAKAVEVDAVPVKRQAMADLGLGPFRAAETAR